MNNTQSWVIINGTTGAVIGTDSRQPFTESAAHQKAAVLQSHSKDKFRVEQLRPLCMALTKE